MELERYKRLSGLNKINDALPPEYEAVFGKSMMSRDIIVDPCSLTLPLSIHCAMETSNRR